MVFGVISDIHMGPDGYSDRGDLRKFGSRSEELVRNFVEEMNNKIRPSFVIQLGDVIEDSTSDDDKKNYKHTLKLLSELKCPVHNVIGNHDIKKLSEQELKRLINQDKLYYSFEIDNFKFIVLFSKRDENNYIIISEQQVQLLRDELGKSDAKTIVFVHHSLADQNLEGNYWFEGLPQHCLIKNRRAIRKILEGSGKVAGVFNGHLHWNRMDIHNGIPYFNIQSLVENYKSDGTPSSSYAVVNWEDDKMQVDVIGNDSARFVYS